MPNGNPGQGQGGGRQAGGTAQGGTRGQSQGQGAAGGAQGQTDAGLADRVRERAEQFAQGARDQFGAARDQAAHGYRQAEGMIARNPGQSVLVGFGVGLGLGVLLAVMLTGREETWYDRWMPDRLRGLPDRLRDLHLADRLRDVPEALSKYIPGR